MHAASIRMTLTVPGAAFDRQTVRGRRIGRFRGIVCMSLVGVVRAYNMCTVCREGKHCSGMRLVVVVALRVEEYS